MPLHDEAGAGVTVFGRPLVLGPVLGAVLGDWIVGARLGVVCELFSLQEPVGGRLPLNGTVAVCAALTLAVRGLAAPAALAAGLGLAWAYGRIESAARHRRSGSARRCEETLARGEEPDLGRATLAAVLGRVLLAAFLLGAAWALRPALGAAWAAAPNFLRAGFELGWGLAPWIGLGALLQTARVP